MTAVHVHENFAACRRAIAEAEGTQPPHWYAIETGGRRRYDEARYVAGDVLLFGSERRGLPTPLLEELGEDALLSIPMREGNRSLNLSNAVTLVTYEAWRQNSFEIRPAAAIPPPGA
jgi:tRNA (cytidine/uridine-2'-O-)-methyltransferase